MANIFLGVQPLGLAKGGLPIPYFPPWKPDKTAKLGFESAYVLVCSSNPGSHSTQLRTPGLGAYTSTIITVPDARRPAEFELHGFGRGPAARGHPVGGRAVQVAAGLQ